MLNNISWGTYLTGVITILAIYEAAIVLLFYRTEVIALLQRRSLRAKSSKPVENTPPTSQDVEIQDGIDSVVADLRGIIGKAGSALSKPELLGQFSIRLKNYAGLRHPVFLAAINNDIIKQANDLCGISFSIEELNKEWGRLQS